jgi:hypothetical protein
MKKDLDFRIVDAAMAELEEQGEKNKIEKINVQVRGFEGTRQI